MNNELSPDYQYNESYNGRQIEMKQSVNEIVSCGMKQLINAVLGCE